MTRMRHGVSVPRVGSLDRQIAGVLAAHGASGMHPSAGIYTENKPGPGTRKLQLGERTNEHRLFVYVIDSRTILQSHGYGTQSL